MFGSKVLLVLRECREIETSTQLPDLSDIFNVGDQEPPKVRRRQSGRRDSRQGTSKSFGSSLPAVEMPKRDAKRKAAPKDGAVKHAGKEKGVAKEKDPLGVAVTPVLFPRHKVVEELQHLQLRHRSPWDCRQVQRCLHFMVVVHPVCLPHVPGDGSPLKAGAVPRTGGLLSIASNDDLRWRHGRANFHDLLNLVINAFEFLEFLVCDQAGAPSATCVSRLTRRCRGNATGWFVEVQYVGCSDSLFDQFHAEVLPPTGTVCCTFALVSSLCLDADILALIDGSNCLVEPCTCVCRTKCSRLTVRSPVLRREAPS